MRMGIGGEEERGVFMLRATYGLLALISEGVVFLFVGMFLSSAFFSLFVDWCDW